ncbi:hypothetical protein [Acinetobacter towneri]|uniref:hypothetical protein n=1 Tax=Acinetobacter towneri TaxID=202956 RepID=UPI001F37C37E|nr:hypothetical protein [Acinetobacter towneri]UIP24782.1 hypothetical protein LZG54_11730 [Acinetobacter towneri]
MLFRSCVTMIIASILGIPLTACSSHPPHSSLSRDAYLQQFMGQSSAYILSHLQLSQIDYQQVGTVEQTKRALRYQVIRPVRIPIPMAQHPTTGIGAVPLNMGIPSHESYDVALSCYIIFHLEHNIATSVSYSGRHC